MKKSIKYLNKCLERIATLKSNHYAFSELPTSYRKYMKTDTTRLLIRKCTHCKLFLILLQSVFFVYFSFGYDRYQQFSSQRVAFRTCFERLDLQCIPNHLVKRF